MRNKHGSVLVITLGFVVAFTMLGMASLHYAMVQNEETERQKASMEAFWLADGAIEYAKAQLPAPIPKENFPVHLMNGQGEIDLNRSYDVLSRKKKDENGNDRLIRWEVFSLGKVNGESRYIKAEFDKFNIPDYPLITSLQPINSPVPPKVIDKIEHFANIICDTDLIDGISPEEFTGVVCVDVKQTNHLSIPTPSSTEVANVLVIDVTKINEGSIIPTITFESEFNGIIFVKGNIKLNEVNLQNVNLKINGTLIVDGQVEFIDNNNNSVSEAEVVFNATMVDEALKYYSGSFTNLRKFRIISWEEVSQLDEQI